MKKLSKTAYGGVAGKDYLPYEDGRKNSAGNPVVIVIGIILAILFAASTAYSGMRAGLTVAAGIPGAILGSGLLSIFIRKNNFLMKNILQSMATGGESIASGLIFVLPAVILIGQQVSFFEGVIVGVSAVLVSLGILSFVQDYLLVEEHGTLVYPEAMAISETLVASSTGGNSLKYMGIGFGVGGLITAFTSAVFGVVNNVVSYTNETFYKWKLEIEVNPMLAAIGFIVGLEVAVMMFAGSILANFGIAPLIGYFSEMAGNGHHVWNDPSTPIQAMNFAAIFGSYVKYIGAGMMISGGMIGAIRLIPTIINSVKATLDGRKNAEAGERDSLGIFAILIGIVATFVVGFIISGGNIAMTFLAGILSIVLSMLFIIVAGRLTGTIGTSNLPVSGMTIASLVILTLVFLTMGWTSSADLKSLLLFGTFIVVAISVAGGYTQAQKVTFITGGNKYEVRRFFLVAAVLGVVVVTGVIVLLRDQLALTGDAAQFALPQANLMATLTDGIIGGELPWHMIIAGIVFGIILYMIKVPVMTFAIGFYLPISTTSIILIGALVRILVEVLGKKDTEAVQEERMSSGVSLSSGLVAGASIIGLLGIILQVSGVVTPGTPTGFVGSNAMAWVLMVILIIAIVAPLMSIKKAPAAEKSDE
ncbi:OPT family oligopeptide transporter [Lactococcus petauri]|uniref:OPT family oligopeptide transporter n=1 Tax=Lactococcus petauri TaxID=1940789 RepID=UPI001BCD54C2|nr:oligopeptide transporter, OPT family [Lactococcus petauri]MBS4460600.1 oligopeptide transporter, OPT family [Lactococcus petauri]